MNNRTAIATIDFDHDCKLGPESGCYICQSRAEFYRMSNLKWARLQEKWRLVRENMERRKQPDAMMISAIMTDSEKEGVCKQ